jgi:cell division septation protein DedD
MNLSVYLTELLKTNDCVIIPDLGGFIANCKSSVSNAQEDQFFPPSKELIFNAKLKKNDGLLVNYICEKEGIGYLEARKIVSESVSECQYKLENGQKIEFDQIGTLLLDQNEHIAFEAIQRDFLRTDTFGLDAVHFPPIVNKYNQPPKIVFRDKDPEPHALRRSALKYALLVLPILAALYFIPKIFLREPATQTQNSNTASLSISDSPAAIKSEVVSASESVKADKPVSDKEIKEAVQVAELSTKHESTQVPHKIATQKSPKPVQSIAQTVVNEHSKGKFHVVGGCFKIRENADKLAGQLIKQGYPAQVTNLGKSFYRVSVESFQTRQEAIQAMNRLLSADPKADYWLMADKN